MDEILGHSPESVRYIMVTGGKECRVAEGESVSVRFDQWSRRYLYFQSNSGHMVSIPVGHVVAVYSGVEHG